MLALPLVSGGPLMLKKRSAHLVQVAGDNDVQAWLRAAPAAGGEDGDAIPCLLRSELIAGELGRQLAQFRWQVCHANHGIPAGIMVCRSPRRPVAAAIAPRFPPLRLRSSSGRTDAGFSRARTGALADAYAH